MVVLRFLGSTWGRGVRVVSGLTLIGTGIVLGDGWLALAIMGVLPLAAGVFDVCVLGPMFRLPFVGRRFREATGGPSG